jgi:UDP-N-acetylmuramoylalanine-D-glutamate ligase
VRFAARLRKRNGGSAVPGLVVNKLAPGYLAHALNSFDKGLVIVSGSSGKSTTTKMLVSVLRDHGLSVFTNPSTANITQGLTSALLERADLRGRIDADIAVLEMDEGHGALISDSLNPIVVVLTNVMTDQIDRFHDSAQVAEMLAKIARRASSSVVINSDDGMLEAIAASLPAGVSTLRFGASTAVQDSARHGLGYAATSSGITPDVLVAATAGRAATVELGGAAIEIELPAPGVHYAMDAAAAVAGASATIGAELDLASAARSISAMDPVFGRGEITRVGDEPVEFVLVQNPASFQLNVDELANDLSQVLVAVGSDVRDPSYFWPVDGSTLGRVAIITGSKAHEIALQLEYQGVTIDELVPELADALDRFFALPRPTSGMKTVIFTADSMRRARTHLGLI